jgi:hypothetical protein
MTSTWSPDIIFKTCVPLVVLIVAWSLLKHRNNPLRTIPGPKWKYPVIGLGFSLPPKPIHVFRKWAQKYGDIFRIRVGWYDWVVINSPEAFKEIFDKQVGLPNNQISALMIIVQIYVVQTSCSYWTCHSHWRHAHLHHALWSEMA